MVGSSQSAALSVSLLARCEKPHLDLRPELYTITSPAVAVLHIIRNAIDAEEDARYGPDRGGDELPAELARRETRLQIPESSPADYQHSTVAFVCWDEEAG
jgi:hypothetical protein